MFKFVVDITTKKPHEARFFFLDSVTVNTVVHTESEACQKQWVGTCARTGAVQSPGRRYADTIFLGESSRKIVGKTCTFREILANKPGRGNRKKGRRGFLKPY